MKHTPGSYGDTPVLHKCDHCGAFQEFYMFYELGGWFYMPEDEDKTYCDCGGEYIPVDGGK